MINIVEIVPVIVSFTFNRSKNCANTNEEEHRRVWNALLGYISSQNNSTIFERIRELEIYSGFTAEDMKFVRMALASIKIEFSQLKDSILNIDFTKNPKNQFDFSNYIFTIHTSFDNFTFDQNVTFFNAHFYSSVSFARATFTKKALFTKAHFDKPVVFEKAKFKNSAIFNGCIFSNYVSMKNIRVEGRASYRRVDFKYPIEFGGAKFRSLVDFSDAKFSDVNFKETNFKLEAIFENSKFRENCAFNYSTFSDHVNFEGATFIIAPSLYGTKFLSSSSWIKVKWPSPPKGKSEALNYTRRYEALTAIMEEADKVDVSVKLFQLQMRTRRVNEDTLSSFANYFYEFICDYGYNLKRAATLWFSQLCIGAVFIYGLVIKPSNLNTLSSEELSTVNDSLLAILYSTANSLPILGWSHLKSDSDMFSDAEKVGSAVANSFRIICLIQSLFAAIILFFVILTLRNKFKIK